MVTLELRFYQILSADIDILAMRPTKRSWLSYVYAKLWKETLSLKDTDQYCGLMINYAINELFNFNWFRENKIFTWKTLKVSFSTTSDGECFDYRTDS